METETETLLPLRFGLAAQLRESVSDRGEPTAVKPERPSAHATDCRCQRCVRIYGESLKRYWADTSR